jgi:putative flippase GtrA
MTDGSNVSELMARLFDMAKSVGIGKFPLPESTAQISLRSQPGRAPGPKLTIRVLRFAAVGVTCYLVQLGLLHLLQSILHLYVADVAAFLLSAQVNFALSLILTWADRRGSERVVWQWIKFNANALLSVTLANAGVFWLLVQMGLHFWLAMLLANVVSAGCTFTINHLFVFKSGEHLQEEIRETPEMIRFPIEPYRPSIAFFMPAFNEAPNVGDAVSRVYEFFDGSGISDRAVIVVDDGSTDETPAALESIRASHPIEVVTHAANAGYGRALRSGFQAALATGHEWIAFCDSDGQFDPADVAMLLVAARSHRVDVVLGFRAKRADNVSRRAAGRLWHGLSRLVLKYDAEDVDCGFKLFRRSAIAAVAHDLQSDYAAISPELLARLHRAGHAFVEVPVPHYPRSNGKQSGLSPKVVLRSFVDLYAVRRELSPSRAKTIAPAVRDSSMPRYQPVSGREVV